MDKLSKLTQYSATRSSVAIITLVVIGLVTYGNALGNQMFWDDDDSILHNVFIQDWSYFSKYFSENFISGAGIVSNYWRPVLLAVFSLEWHLWSHWAAGYHAVNIAVHVLNGVLLFWLLDGLFKRRWLAWTTALLFVIHPLQTEAVTYVTGLADPLFVLWTLTGLLAYIRMLRVRKKRGVWYALVLLCYALALMTKETAIVFPLLIVLVDLVERGGVSRNNVFACFKSTLPFFCLAISYVILRATALNFQNTFNLYNETNPYTQSLTIRVLTFFKSLITYCGLLFWPKNLHMERSIPLARALEPLAVFGATIFFGLLTAAALAVRRYPIITFGIAWFFIGLAPVSNIAVPINGVLYEHWLYLPIVGVALIVVWGLGVLALRLRLVPLAALILALSTGLLVNKTMARNAEWRDPVTFYSQTLRYAPTSYRVINNLGMAYYDRGDMLHAEALYRQAIALDEDNPVAHHNLGNALRSQGRREEAEQEFRQAITLDPSFLFSYNTLASLYLDANDYERARQVLEQKLPQEAEPLQTYWLLIQIAEKQGDMRAGNHYLDAALKMYPRHPLLLQLRGR